MTTPDGIKEIWRNCTWKNDKEKLAFFNHYFKDSSIVADYLKKYIDEMKDELANFIIIGKIKDGTKEREIEIKDILQRLKKED
jgi:hypothetical protein